MKTNTAAALLLSASAIVLAVLLFALPGTTRTAKAEMTASGGDWSLLTASSTTGGDELLFVVDTLNQKMLSYQLVGLPGQLKVIGKVDLQAVFTPLPGGGPAPKAGM